tara:strand:- start:585 stop:848 length:264 start_codon:yes stop_codon:yes gene_type:complete
MTSNEFVFWLKGIVDSTTFMPTKATWDIITDTLKEVKLNTKETAPLDNAVVRRLTDIQNPFPNKSPEPNPYEIRCDKTSEDSNPLKQ